MPLLFKTEYSSTMVIQDKDVKNFMDILTRIKALEDNYSEGYKPKEVNWSASPISDEVLDDVYKAAIFGITQTEFTEQRIENAKQESTES